MESTQPPFVTRKQRLEPEFDYLPPSSAEIKNKRSYIHLMARAEKTFTLFLQIFTCLWVGCVVLSDQIFIAQVK
jgi:hypothetical protein